MKGIIANMKKSLSERIEEVRQGEHRTVFNVIAWIIMIVAITPIALIFTCGEHGGITVWNFVGLAYLMILCFTVKVIMDK